MKAVIFFLITLTVSVVFARNNSYSPIAFGSDDSAQLLTSFLTNKNGAKLFGQTQVAATAITITGTSCGKTYYNTGAVVVGLSTDIPQGCEITFITMNASNYDLNPADLDQIFGLTNAAGDSLRNATKGNSIKLQRVTGGFAATSAVGTWSDNN